jgi:hypothetical protein
MKKAKPTTKRPVQSVERTTPAAAQVVPIQSKTSAASTEAPVGNRKPRSGYELMDRLNDAEALLLAIDRRWGEIHDQISVDLGAIELGRLACVAAEIIAEVRCDIEAAELAASRLERRHG